jgi:hypothetical protein
MRVAPNHGHVEQKLPFPFRSNKFTGSLMKQKENADLPEVNANENPKDDDANQTNKYSGKNDS